MLASRPVTVEAMETRGAQPPGPVARWLRGLWPDRNPLRRATDRAEAAILALLVMLFLVAVPAAARLAGEWSDDSAGLRPVRAVLLADASAPHGAILSAGAGSRARARWPEPGGTWRTGVVPVPTGAQAGGHVNIWLNASGRPVTPPAGIGRLAAIAAAFATALVVLAAGWMSSGILERRRMTAWEQEWRITGPRWASRLDRPDDR
jgi:hypothetical protein